MRWGRIDKITTIYEDLRNEVSYLLIVQYRAVQQHDPASLECCCGVLSEVAGGIARLRSLLVLVEGILGREKRGGD